MLPSCTSASSPLLLAAGLTEAYVKAINEGAVPTIATAWQSVAEAECRRAADAAEGCYVNSFNQDLAAEETALEAEHQRCLEAGLLMFADNAVGRCLLVGCCARRCPAQEVFLRS